VRVLIDGAVLVSNDVLSAGVAHNLRSMLFRGIEPVIAADAALGALLEEYGFTDEVKSVPREVLADGLSVSTFELCITGNEEVARFAEACKAKSVLVGPTTAIVTFGAGALLKVF
jgi:hypothetical protein